MKANAEGDMRGAAAKNLEANQETNPLTTIPIIPTPHVQPPTQQAPKFQVLIFATHLLSSSGLRGPVRTRHLYRGLQLNPPNHRNPTFRLFHCVSGLLSSASFQQTSVPPTDDRSEMFMAKRSIGYGY
jgi:hypothetical protein